MPDYVIAAMSCYINSYFPGWKKQQYDKYTVSAHLPQLAMPELM